MPTDLLSFDVAPVSLPLTVVLIGAESTGKTTLARALARHYSTVWVPEYVRTFVAQYDRAPALSDVPHLAAGHLCAVRRARPQAHRLLVLDTDLLSTVVYSRHYFGTCPPRIEAAAYRHRADRYLLLADDIPWTPDPGQRDGPATRAELQPRFAEVLDVFGVRWTTVQGTSGDRLRTATAYLDAALAARD